MVPYVRKSYYKHYNELCDFIEEIPLLHKKRIKIADPKTVSIEDPVYKKGFLSKVVARFANRLTKKELAQAVEGLLHNLNTLQSRSGNQLPFTSVNFGTCTSPEGRMVIRAMLEGSIAGVGKLHRTPIFPCSIFQVGEGINKHKGDPNYDLFKLALKSTSKRLYPNYGNIDWSGNKGYDKNDPRTYFSTMGCRTSNGFDVNGLGYQKDGRGNICPVTIILPELAMQAITKEGDTIENFFQILNIKIDEAKDMLLERFEWICSQPASSAKFMYENGTMAGYVPEEGIRSALKHGTLAIGQIALAETLQILIKKDHTTKEGLDLAIRIEELFSQKCAEFKKQYQLNFGVYYTPAENLCYTAMKKFKEKWGIIPNVSDRDYFTNSTHVPVWKEISPFDKIDIEAQLSKYSSAGCITYIELEGAVSNNLEALEQFVVYAMDKDVPYFATNIPNDTCLEDGFTGEFNDACPVCGSTHIQQLRRVTGYLTGDYKTAFNKGKQQETEQRKKHTGVRTR